MVETRGRKSVYETKIKPHLSEITERIGKGAIESELYAWYDISYATWRNHKNKHKEFAEAIERGREKQKFNLLFAAFKSAIGYEYSEETIMTETRGDITTVRKTVAKKHSRPDSGMIQFLLINRFYDEFQKDPHATAIRREALELQKKGLIEDIVTI